MTDNEPMPLTALPYFLRLALSFTNALTESVEVYKDDQDREAFAKILHHLSTDLDYYINVYQTWTDLPDAPRHERDLTTLGNYLEDAQKVLSAAVELIRH